MTIKAEAQAGYTLEANKEKVKSPYEIFPGLKYFGIRDPRGMLTSYALGAFPKGEGGWFWRPTQKLKPGKSKVVEGAKFTGA